MQVAVNVRREVVFGGEVDIAEAKEVAALAEVGGVVELAWVKEVMGLGEVV